MTSQTAFNRTMLNASPAAQDLVASYNGGKVSAQGMATAQNATKVSTIGLTIAQTALNAAIGMGIGLVISLVTQGISKLIHANEEAVESAEELREKYEDFKSTNDSNISTLKGLEYEFDELSKGVSQYGDNISLTTEQYERYTEIIQQIVGMSPSLAEGYSTENGYIADKNGLLERAIELQEIEYKNELRKMTNLENLKTSMSGYIAEYNDALHGGYITAEGNIIGTTIDTDFKNSLWELFNTNNRDNYDAQSMAKDIMESLGVEDIDAEMQTYFNDYGYWQDSWFWDDYCDTIINNLNAVTDSLSFEEVGLDEEVFNQNLEKLGSYAESYRDMKDSVEMANDAIQTDLGYIAEYADGYSNLSTEQKKFVSDFLKGFDISDVATEDGFGKLKYDNDKMASVKSQIKDFVKDLSQDESTKKALSDLYAIPTDEQSISEYVEQFRTALDIIKTYCEENGIEIPIAITNKEKEINELEAQQQRVLTYTKEKFEGDTSVATEALKAAQENLQDEYTKIEDWELSDKKIQEDFDWDSWFKKNSINTKEEIDNWLEIAQAANSAAEAMERYAQISSVDKEVNSITSQIESLQGLTDGFEIIDKIYVKAISDEYQKQSNDIDHQVDLQRNAFNGDDVSFDFINSALEANAEKERIAHDDAEAWRKYYRENTNLADEEIEKTAEVQDAQKRWWEAEQNSYALYQEAIDKVTKAMEKQIKTLEYEYEQQNLIIDALEKKYEFQRKLREEQRDLKAEYEATQDIIAISGDDGTLFNKEDYDTLLDKIKNIDGQMTSLYENYRNDINALSEDEWYKQTDLL